MTKSQQVGVLGALLAVILVVGGWRTWSAIQDARHPGPAWKEKTPAEWLTHLKVVSIEGEAPEGVVPTGPPSRHCNGLPNIPLAKVRWRDRLETFPEFEETERGIVFPVFNKIRELNGNCVMRTGVDDRGEELEPGEGWLNLTIALTHTGKVPFAKLPQRHQPLCIVTEVSDQSEAERAGIKRGDLLVSVDDLDLSKQIIPGDVCITLMNAMAAHKPNEPYTMTLVHDGAVISVPRVGGVLFGFRFTHVQVLDSDLQ